MNSFQNNPSNKRQARQAIDGFIQPPRKASGSQNRLGSPNPLRVHKQPVIDNGIRSNLRGADSPALRGSIDGFGGKSTKSANIGGGTRSQDKGFVAPQKETPKKLLGDAQSSKPMTRKQRRAHKRKNRKTWKTWALRGSIATFLIVILFGGFLITKGYLKLNQVFKGGGAAAALDANVDPTKLKGEGDGRVNILLLGRGGAGHDGPDLTDTVLVASIDPVNNKSALVSVPRDLWVKSKTGSSKLNAVFANSKQRAIKRGADATAADKAGVEATEEAIEKVLGLNIHYFTVVDFAGFEKAVNTVGGVNINVPEQLRDSTMAWENKGNPVLAREGEQEMKGKQALMYVRSRHGSARGDFDRAERQRLFIMALKDAIMSSGTFSNPVKISKLMDDFGDHVKTDFGMNDLRRLYSLTKNISGDNMESIGLADPPNDYLTTGSFGGQSIVQPKDGLFEYDAIKEYIRKKLPDGYIIKEKAPITVLNGTATEGMATKVGDDLKTYSYNVQKVDNAPTQDYQKTIIVDLNGKNKFTKNYLERRFDVKATRKLPEGIVVPEHERKGFVIIIGSNEVINR